MGWCKFMTAAWVSLVVKFVTGELSQLTPFIADNTYVSLLAGLVSFGIWQ
jgi:hypothetical protein